MESTGNNKIFIYLLVVFFAVFIGSGLFLMISNKKNNSTAQVAVTATVQPSAAATEIAPTVAMGKGYINLKSELTTSKLANPLNLLVVANSNNENVTAFDTLVTFDPAAFDFVSAVSTDSNFKVYPYVKDNGLTLTVLKTGNTATPSVFSDVTVINLVFKPKKIGPATFKVAPSIGKETTKFVNDKTEIIYPSVNELVMTIN